MLRGLLGWLVVLVVGGRCFAFWCEILGMSCMIDGRKHGCDDVYEYLDCIKNRLDEITWINLFTPSLFISFRVLCSSICKFLIRREIS